MHNLNLGDNICPTLDDKLKIARCIMIFHSKYKLRCHINQILISIDEHNTNTNQSILILNYARRHKKYKQHIDKKV